MTSGKASWTLALSGLAMLASIAGTPCAGASRRRLRLEVRPHIEASLRTASPQETTIPLGGGRLLPVTFDATNKGNGSLSVAGRTFRVWDEHDEGWIWEDGYLDLQLDLSASGEGPRLILTGIACDTERGRRTPVRASYPLDPASRDFAAENCPTGTWVSRPTR